MTLDESIQGMRLQVIRRAAVVGVSAACREAGISRTLFYRWQQRLSRYGVDGLHPRRLHAQPGPAPQLPPAAERRLLAVAIAEATWGAATGAFRGMEAIKHQVLRVEGIEDVGAASRRGAGAPPAEAPRGGNRR